MSVRDMLMAAAGVDTGGGSDDNFKNVTLLLNGDGTNGAQNNTFVDSSSNNFSITRNGNTTQGSFSPYGSNWSNYFNVGQDDYLNVASSSSIPATGDFTYECWVFPIATDGYRGALTSRHSSYPNYGFVIGLHDGNGYFYVNTTLIADASGIVANQWNHLVLVRSGSGSNNCSAYINGTRVGQATETGSTNQNTVAIGRFYENNLTSFKFNGYISNVRMVNGSALYSGSTLTVPTTPLTAVSGTVLLTCQSNRFIDNSSNALSVTPNEFISVQRFSPFNPTASYDTATIGGSGYFDGSGDYLATPTSSAFNLGTGNWTIEGWFYPTNLSTRWKRFLVITTSSGDYGLINGEGGALNALEWNLFGSGSYFASANGSIPNNAWTHVAIVYDGSVTRFYINGSQSGTTYSGNALANSNSTVYLCGYGGTYAGDPLQGNVSDFRVTKSAVYTANFTPPTAPLSSITNTSLLLNMTNAGIPDSAMMNDLETVGNAQVSTSVKKFGTGSLYFDGTGDYLTAPLSNNFAFGTGDFTIECWIYLPTTPSGGYAAILDTREAGGSASNAILFCVNSSLGITVDPGISTSGNFSTNTWHHVALCQASGVMQAFVDGSSVASYTNTNNRTKTGCYIGRVVDNAHPAFNGYIDDLRITKGYARYTSTFTPPTAALPVK